MTYHRRVAAQISRTGRQVSVLTRKQTGTDDFNNPTYGFTDSRTVIASRTYPNRNTEVKSSAGDLHRDRPVFIFPRGPEAPEPPGEDDRIRYDGIIYEMQAPTEYDTHIEYFGQRVRE